MCLYSRTIYNRSTFLDPTCSAGFLDVPCGKCPECQDMKKTEYSLRGYIEWKDCIAKGGFAYFETLTYNAKSLNKRKWHGLPSFCPEDLRLFHHKLRRSLKDICDYRYIQASEYGGLFKRPHYHLIFFLYPKCAISHSELLYLFRFKVLSAWKEPLTNSKGDIIYTTDKHGLKKMRMRSLGFIDSIKTLTSRVLDRVSAINYCSKYICKDQDFVKDAFEHFKNVADDKGYTKDMIEYQDLMDDFKKHLPFHRQSQSFGGSLVDDLKAEIDKLCSDPYILRLAVSSKPLMLPLYYIRKLFYNLVPSGLFDPETGKPKMIYRPNKYGKLYESIQLDKRIDKFVDKFESALLSFPMYDKDCGDLRINEILGTRSMRDFVIYKLVYKGHFHDNHAFNPNTENYHAFYEKSRLIGELENYAYDDDQEVKKEFRDYMCSHIINDTIYSGWYGFDEIDSIFSAYFRQRGNSISEARNLIRDINNIHRYFNKKL